MSACHGILSAGGMGTPAMRSPLCSDLLLDVTLSAMCSRAKYRRDVDPVLDDLRAIDGADAWISLGRKRRGAKPHGAPMRRPQPVEPGE